MVEGPVRDFHPIALRHFRGYDTTDRASATLAAAPLQSNTGLPPFLQPNHGLGGGKQRSAQACSG
jgi:hypothetical protein